VGLIHIDLVDLKQTMFRGCKNYFVTFINDFSRYTKVYLIKHKDHWDALLRLKKYLRGTMDYVIENSRFPTVVEGTIMLIGSLIQK